MGQATAELSQRQTETAMRLFLGQGAMLGAYWAVGMPANPIIAGFAMDVLGLSKENAGFLGTVVYASAVFQLLSFVLTNRVARKKRFVVAVGAAEMLLLLGAVLSSWLVSVTGKAISAQCLLLALLFLAGACSNLVQPLLSGWLAAVVPAERRGRYLGLRMILLAGFQTGAAWLGLRVVGRWTTPGGFLAVFAVCCACGVVGYALLARAPMPQISADSVFRFSGFSSAWRHEPFRRYLVFIAFLTSGFALACSYYSPFFLKEIGLSFRQVSWYLLGFYAMKFACMWPTGLLVDRVGSRPVIQAMTLIYAVFFLLFPLFTQARLWLIVAVWSFVGIAESMYFVAVTSTLFHSLPAGRERSGFLGIAQGFVLLSMAVGPLLVRPYLSWAGDLEVIICGIRLEKFRLLFSLSGLLMLTSLIPASRLHDTHDVGWARLIASVRWGKPFRLLPRWCEPNSKRN